MNPLPPAKGKMSQAHTSGIFLEKPGLLKEALKRNKEWDNTVPGSFGETVEVTGEKRVGTLEEALLKLKEEKEAGASATVLLSWQYLRGTCPPEPPKERHKTCPQDMSFMSRRHVAT